MDASRSLEREREAGPELGPDPEPEPEPEASDLLLLFRETASDILLLDAVVISERD